MKVTLENGKYYIDEDYIIERRVLKMGAIDHTHDFIELTYMLKGHCLHIIDGHEYPASRGDMAFINYNSVHAMPPGGNAQYINILIKPEFIDQSLQGSENAFSILALKDFRDFSNTIPRGHLMMHFSGRERSQLESLMDCVDDAMNHKVPGSELIVRSCINIILTMVFRKMDLPMKDPNTLNNELLEYIRSNCTSPLSLESIATKAGYNPSYFSRLFKQYTGSTFSDYLVSCRIQVAAKLLEDTQMRVEDIISEVGYSNRTKFFKDFTEKQGMSPLQYRKSRS